jgi:hypothetical protein
MLLVTTINALLLLMVRLKSACSNSCELCPLPFDIEIRRCSAEYRSDPAIFGANGNALSHVTTRVESVHIAFRYRYITSLILNVNSCVTEVSHLLGNDAV